MKHCLRQKCQKEFEPTKPKQKFCSAKCRTYYTREEGKKEKLRFPAPGNIERKIDELFQKLDKITFAPATEASYDGVRLPEGYVADEPLSFDRMKSEIQKPAYNHNIPPQIVMRNYWMEKTELTADMYPAWLENLYADTRLNTKQKDLIKNTNQHE